MVAAPKGAVVVEGKPMLQCDHCGLFLQSMDVMGEHHDRAHPECEHKREQIEFEVVADERHDHPHSMRELINKVIESVPGPFYRDHERLPEGRVGFDGLIH